MSIVHMRSRTNKERSRRELCKKMRNVMVWVFLVVVVLVLGLAEAGRKLHPHLLFEGSSREELVDLAGYGEEKLSTVFITGSVLCPVHEPSAPPLPVSGVRVGVTCTSVDKSTKKISSEETVTDEYGDFTIDLPSHLHGTQNLDESCQVKVVKVPIESFATMEHNKVMVKLASARNGVRTYTTGKIHLKRRVKLESGRSMASAIMRLAKLPIEKWRG